MDCRSRLVFPIVAIALLPGVNARSVPSLQAAGPVKNHLLFEQDIRPLLSARCWRCHGEKKPKARLDLRTRAGMLQGGESGPALVPGSADKSLLFEMIRQGKMPPQKGAGLTPEQIALVRSWIDGGAQAATADVAPAQTPAYVITEEDRKFWAFQKPVRPPVPHVRAINRVRTPIDAFILDKLEAKGLTLSPDAERTVLLRRVYFDLVGLPPTPAEVDAFLADDRPDAYERVVDRLLASPHYGERWGRHWLDAAGYADVGSTDNDADIINLRDGIWRYRDYVIRSLNRDKPYDRFLTEQLAGDELDDWRSAGDFTPDIEDHLIATGFLRTGVDSTFAPELNLPPERFDVLHRTIETFTSNVLGLTVGCARCHDHKFDPIPQTDYYRLMACLTPAYNPQSWLIPQDRVLEGGSAVHRERIKRRKAAIVARLADLQKLVDALRRPHEQKLFEARLVKLPEVLRADVRAALLADPAKRSAVQKYLADKLGPVLQVPLDAVLADYSEAERKKEKDLFTQIHALRDERDTLGQKIQALFDVGPAPATHLLRRGNYLTPGPEVQPGAPLVLSPPTQPGSFAAKAQGPSSGRRLALARWLTSPDNPLTARVIVNRVWQHHFGQGIVATPDNFGHAGARPTHPELLDWLAVEFVDRGWSFKALHRLIVTSTVYRQASAETAISTSDQDPGNQLLGKMRLRRLDSEVIRDAVLAVSGKLDPTMGGAPVPLEARKDGMVVVAEKGLPTPTSKWRRSVYLLARRNYNLSMLSVFDQPVMSTNCTRRVSSAVPLQALTFMNDAFIFEQAEHFARRVAAGAGPSPIDRIETAFRVAFARRPTGQETAWAAELLEKQARRYGEQKLPPEQARFKALTSLCHMLLCANEFLYVE